MNLRLENFCREILKNLIKGMSLESVGYLVNRFTLFIKYVQYQNERFEWTVSVKLILCKIL